MFQFNILDAVVNKFAHCLHTVCIIELAAYGDLELCTKSSSMRCGSPAFSPSYSDLIKIRHGKFALICTDGVK